MTVQLAINADDYCRVYLYQYKKRQKGADPIDRDRTACDQHRRLLPCLALKQCPSPRSTESQKLPIRKLRMETIPLNSCSLLNRSWRVLCTRTNPAAAEISAVRTPPIFHGLLPPRPSASPPTPCALDRCRCARPSMRLQGPGRARTVPRQRGGFHHLTV
jgi:hypothetical protein